MEIPSGTSFHGVSSEVPTENKGSEQTNSRRNSFTIEEIASAGYVKNVKVSLTAAQLKSLDTTEVEAIPNPGVGKFIKINSAIWSFVWGTTPFDAVTVKLNQECDTGYATCPFTLSRTSDRLREGDYDTNTNSCPNSNVTVGGSDNSVLTGDSTVDVYISYQIITL